MYTRALLRCRKRLFCFSRALFVKNKTTNELYGAGDIIKRPKYADTLEIIAQQGVDTFYTGALADKIVKEIQDRHGIITKKDLADFQVDFREALSIEMNATLTAFTTHAPSSGPILAFILNILQGKEKFHFHPGLHITLSLRL